MLREDGKTVWYDEDFRGGRIPAELDYVSCTEGGGPQVLPRKTAYGSDEAGEAGLIPFVEEYQGLAIEPSRWQEVIEHCHRKKIFPIYFQEKARIMPPWDQDGYGYCWAYGLVAAIHNLREREGQTPIRLSPFSLGWLVNWRNQGFYCDQAIAGARQRGIAPVEYVPEYNLRPSTFKPGWEKEALKYRPLEWWDIPPGRSNRATDVIGACLAVLSTGTPLYIAYDWWSHALSMVSMEWDPKASYNVTFVCWNSHNGGEFVRFGTARGIPDEAYGPRASTLTS